VSIGKIALFAIRIGAIVRKAVELVVESSGPFSLKEEAEGFSGTISSAELAAMVIAMRGKKHTRDFIKSACSMKTCATPDFSSSINVRLVDKLNLEGGFMIMSLLPLR
jgi:hypothetical protein